MKFGTYLLWVVIAAVVGLIVLLGYFISSPLILDLRQLLMQWAVILAAAAIFMGLINLFIVHWNKVNDQTAGWAYSAILIFLLLVSLALGLIFGPDFEVMFLLFNYVQLPIEAGLMALLAVSLVVAGFRMVSRRRDIFSFLFALTAILVLLGNSPWLMGSDSTVAHLIGNVRAWVAQVWSAGGARGILLGVALGAVATGLRVLMGAERPYGD
ncbi:MAG: hypothetical protein A2Z14_08010 [Chloroflexi bacterium RBG_16_48_8]|nr:MAG: hypothetical protein A2Z14_08010 [Chloroflexi bacterium RBG_16_48_8]